MLSSYRMKIKQLPQDFFVEEVLSKTASQDGDYVWFTLEKTDRNLLDIIDLISKQLGVSSDHIGYAGLKDKSAVTKQTLSIFGVSIDKLKKVKIDGVKLSNFKKSSEAIRLGDLLENKFRIVVRDIEKTKEKFVAESVVDTKKSGVVNLFDEQRFGINKNTHIIGKLILRKDFEKAVKEFTKNDRSRWTNLIDDYLNNHKHDYCGAIRSLPKTLQMLFVNAYQSYLFNQMALEYAKKSRKNSKLPIVGYDTILENYPEVLNIANKILKKENIRPEDFRTKQLPIKAKGAERDLLIFPKNLKYKIEKDELNKNKLKITFEFALQKGAYATQVIKEIFSEYVN